MQTTVNVYELKNDNFIKIDFVKLHKSMKKSGLTVIEKEVKHGHTKYMKCYKLNINLI